MSLNLDDMMAAMGLPVGFGKKSMAKNAKSNNSAKTEKTSEIGKEITDHSDAIGQDQDSDDDFGPQPAVNMDQEELDDLPLSNSVLLKAHSKSVTAVSLDPSGGRLITGGRDNQVVIWDFHAMDKRLHHYKKFEPIEGNPVFF
jgi:WD40 repeat protein